MNTTTRTKEEVARDIYVTAHDAYDIAKIVAWNARVNSRAIYEAGSVCEAIAWHAGGEKPLGMVREEMNGAITGSEKNIADAVASELAAGVACRAAANAWRAVQAAVNKGGVIEGYARQ